jgi:DNA-binding XRE family transcriptional regulator
MSLRSWRHSHHLTQRELGHLLGCSKETVYKREKYGVTDRFIGMFAKKFPDDVREIMEESDVPTTAGRSVGSLGGDLQ